LDSSVVAANGVYNTSVDDGAGLLGWSATSSVGNGFSISGAFSEIGNLLASGMSLSFDAFGVLSGITNNSDRANTVFGNAGVGKVVFRESAMINTRVDYDASFAGGSFTDETNIHAAWTVADANNRQAPIAAVPLPAGLPLLAFGLSSLFLARRRRRS
jgi:hypothetical protein